MAEPGFGLFCPQKILRTEDRASRHGFSVPDTCVPSDRPGPYPRVQRSSPHARPHLREAGHARKTALTCGVSGSGDPGGGAFRQVWPTWFGGDGVVRGHFEIGDSFAWLPRSLAGVHLPSGAAARGQHGPRRRPRCPAGELRPAGRAGCGCGARRGSGWEQQGWTSWA